MRSLPVCPTLNLSLPSSRIFLNRLINVSSEKRQAPEPEKKFPHLLYTPNREDPSRRQVPSAIYFPRKLYPSLPKKEASALAVAVEPVLVRSIIWAALEVKMLSFRYFCMDILKLSLRE